MPYEKLSCCTPSFMEMPPVDVSPGVTFARPSKKALMPVTRVKKEVLPDMQPIVTRALLPYVFALVISCMLLMLFY